jgi:hypothetical protein
MGRRLEQTVAATHGALVEGERVVAYGYCWAAQLRRIPLVFLGRRRYLLLLTNRRVLLFNRRGRHHPRPNDLVIGKRYEWFKLGRVRRVRPLMQVLVTTGNDARMIFEFSPRRRELGRTLVGRLGDGTGSGEPGLGEATESTHVDHSAFWGPSTGSS